jgi:hypothetical protein
MFDLLMAHVQIELAQPGSCLLHIHKYEQQNAIMCVVVVEQSLRSIEVFTVVSLLLS